MGRWEFDVEFGGDVQATPQQRAAAARVIRAHCHNPADILAMLGLS